MGQCLSSPKMIQLEQDVIDLVASMLKTDTVIALKFIDTQLMKNIPDEQWNTLNTMKTQAVESIVSEKKS